MWEPRRLTTVWAFTACYRDSFTLPEEYVTCVHEEEITVANYVLSLSWRTLTWRHSQLEDCIDMSGQIHSESTVHQEKDSGAHRIRSWKGCGAGLHVANWKFPVTQEFETLLSILCSVLISFHLAVHGCRGMNLLEIVFVCDQVNHNYCKMSVH
jgi:hypothetical protein